jgi:hypothetical protein
VMTPVFWLKTCLDCNGKTSFLISLVLFALPLLISLDLSNTSLFGRGLVHSRSSFSTRLVFLASNW